MSDFEVHDAGSVFLFTPMTPIARNFADDAVNLESWQWLGASFAVDHRYAQDLLEGLQDSGFEVALI